ncbi:MAG: hypothetical protein QNL05_09985 [Gammaproteobacteria bacterium]|nr:hypothetical protein [Gammaproteobacteria bacterium]MDX2487893.1 hypothetical protein [Gammaproteobacteria bacterium]
MHEELSRNKFEVTEVEKTTAPEGMPGDNWYRYVIQKGKQVIDCKKTGSLKAVTEHAESVAELINSRHLRGSRK